MRTLHFRRIDGVSRTSVCWRRRFIDDSAMPLDRDVAAQCIQSFYRRCRMREVFAFMKRSISKAVRDAAVSVVMQGT